VMRRLADGLLGLHLWRQDWAIPTSGAISQARKRLG
jgi:hypothetical protein